MSHNYKYIISCSFIVLLSSGCSRFSNKYRVDDIDNRLYTLHFTSDGIIENKLKNQNNSLFDAVKIGDLESLKIGINSGYCINARDPITQASLLHYAAAFQQFDCMEFLLENDADVDAQDEHGYTSLFLAVGSENIKCINLLLDKDANVNIKDLYGSTLLHYLVSIENITCINLLLNKGASVNTKDINGCTPMHLSILNLYSQNLSYLQEKNAMFLNRYNQYNGIIRKYSEVLYGRIFGMYKPECRANIKITESLIKCFIEHGVINEKDEYGRTPLHYASALGDLNCMRLLLKDGADVNEKDVYDRTPLHCTVALVDVNENEKDTYDRTPLYYSEVLGDVNCMRLLLKDGADVNEKDVYDRTPLHYSVDINNLDCMRLLLKHGVDINAQDSKERTAMYLAVVKKQSYQSFSEIEPLAKRVHDVEKVKLLLKYKADITNLSEHLLIWDYLQCGLGLSDDD